tara:strand:+ start:27 stop:473 length:447 start_codon:yes stop_codon:yes gene_type:complete
MKNPYKKIISNIKNTINTKKKRRTLREDGTVPPLPKDYVETRLEIDYIFIEQLYAKQNGRCYWFPEVELNLDLLWISKHPMAPSVDRLCSTVTETEGHYSPDNIVLTTRFVNFGRCAYEGDFVKEVVTPFKEAILNPSMVNNLEECFQ